MKLKMMQLIFLESFGANSKTPIDENFLKSAMDLFYRQSNEVSFGASEMTLREYAIQNTLDFNLMIQSLRNNKSLHLQNVSIVS